MYVSVNTVKTHLKHVYRKLDVVIGECVRCARASPLGAGLGERWRGPELPGAAVDFAARSLRRFVEIEGSAGNGAGGPGVHVADPVPRRGRGLRPGGGGPADKIDDAFNLSGSAERSMRALFNSAGETESCRHVVSIIILILSTTSFSRAMQRMFERSYEVDKAPLRRRGGASIPSPPSAPGS